MKFSTAILGGTAGAVALTLLHETVRRVSKKAPRMDRLGMEALGKTLEAADVTVPEEDELFTLTMAGDVISNSLYYSLAGLGNETTVVPIGTALGLAAGFGAVYLPKPLGLNEAPSNRTTDTKLMTVTLYLFGGVVSSIAMKLLNKNQE